ncbi:MAG: M56 family metallopeptidase [Verrucomicrobiota bacterium]
MNINDQLAALGWAILLSFLPLLLLGAIGLLVLRWVDLRQASLRYSLGLTFLIVLQVAFLGWWVSSYRNYELSIREPGAIPIQLPVPVGNSAISTPPAAQSTGEVNDGQTLVESDPVVVAAESAEATSFVTRFNQFVWHHCSQPLAPWAYWVGLVAFLGMILRLVFVATQYLWARKLANCSGAPMPRRAYTVIGSLKERMGIGQEIEVKGSTLINSPLVIGGLRSTLLIPADNFWSNEDDEGLEGILAHELAHIKRHDYWVNLWQVTTEVVLFFQPAVWLLNRHVRLERENCCDDLATQSGSDRIQYAKALAQIEERRMEGGHVLAASGLAARESTLGRVSRILAEADSPPLRFPTYALFVPLAVLGVLLAWRGGQFAVAEAYWHGPSDVEIASAASGIVPPESVALINENFDNGTSGPWWLRRWVSESPTGRRQFLGPFWPSDRQLLNLADLESHQAIKIEFDLLILGSWGGHGQYGPSEWKLWVDGGPTLLHTSFNNIFLPEEISPVGLDGIDKYQQHFPDSIAGASEFIAGSGASETQALGYLRHCELRDYDFSADAMYRFSIIVPHSTESLRLYMGGQPSREWGIDNFSVTLLGGVNELGPDQRQMRWNDLVGDDAGKIDQARWAFIADGQASLGFLQEQVAIGAVTGNGLRRAQEIIDIALGLKPYQAEDRYSQVSVVD